MLIKSVIQKVLAFFLVFTLTFANIALVTKSYASTLFASVFSSSSGTGGNVEFDAYFEDEIEKEIQRSFTVSDGLTGVPLQKKFSKEVEHSASNMEFINTAIRKSRFYSTENLINILEEIK